jgi:hypothetical protein
MLGPFVSERKFNYSPVSPRRYDSRSLRSVVRWQYKTLGLHDYGFHPNFFRVSAENSRSIGEMFGYSQIDRVVPAVAIFEVNLGFVSSRTGRSRERQTFTDQL